MKFSRFVKQLMAYSRWFLIMLKSYRFSAPKIEQCLVTNEIICEGHVTRIVLNLHGWGWVRVHVKGTPSKLSRVIRAIFWPNWLTGFKNPDWPGYCTFVSTIHSKVEVYAPCDERLQIRFINIFGFETVLFNVPAATGDIGHSVCSPLKLIRNSWSKVNLKSIHLLTSLKPVLDTNSNLWTPRVAVGQVRIDTDKVSPKVSGIKISSLSIDKISNEMGGDNE